MPKLRKKTFNAKTFVYCETKEEAKQFMTQAQKEGLHNTSEYISAEENYLKQTALEQLAKNK